MVVLVGYLGFHHSVGYILSMRFAGNDLWVFGIFLIFIAGLIIIAYWLCSIRDVDQEL